MCWFPLNPALQAVLMVLEMRDAIGALTGKWRRFGHEIGFGIGIALATRRSAPLASRAASATPRLVRSRMSPHRSARRARAPTVAGLEAREAEVRRRCGQIVSARLGKKSRNSAVITAHTVRLPTSSASVIT
jgi:hypothetical protein